MRIKQSPLLPLAVVLCGVAHPNTPPCSPPPHFLAQVTAEVVLPYSRSMQSSKARTQCRTTGGSKSNLHVNIKIREGGTSFRVNAQVDVTQTLYSPVLLIVFPFAFHTKKRSRGQPQVFGSAASSRPMSGKAIKVRDPHSSTSQCHRRVLHSSLQGIRLPDLRRLARRGGVKCISAEVASAAREALHTFLTDVLHDSVLLTVHARKNTVGVSQVLAALKRAARPLYGFEEPQWCAGAGSRHAGAGAACPAMPGEAAREGARHVSPEPGVGEEPYYLFRALPKASRDKVSAAYHRLDLVTLHTRACGMHSHAQGAGEGLMRLFPTQNASNRCFWDAALAVISCIMPRLTGEEQEAAAAVGGPHAAEWGWAAFLQAARALSDAVVTTDAARRHGPSRTRARITAYHDALRLALMGSAYGGGCGEGDPAAVLAAASKALPLLSVVYASGPWVGHGAAFLTRVRAGILPWLGGCGEPRDGMAFLHAVLHGATLAPCMELDRGNPSLARRFVFLSLPSPRHVHLLLEALGCDDLEARRSMQLPRQWVAPPRVSGFKPPRIAAVVGSRSWGCAAVRQLLLLGAVYARAVMVGHDEDTYGGHFTAAVAWNQSLLLLDDTRPEVLLTGEQPGFPVITHDAAAPQVLLGLLCELACPLTPAPCRGTQKG